MRVRFLFTGSFHGDSPHRRVPFSHGVILHNGGHGGIAYT